LSKNFLREYQLPFPQDLKKYAGSNQKSHKKRQEITKRTRSRGGTLWVLSTILKKKGGGKKGSRKYIWRLKRKKKTTRGEVA